jgi:hypothetical protein
MKNLPLILNMTGGAIVGSTSFLLGGVAGFIMFFGCMLIATGMSLCIIGDK